MDDRKNRFWKGPTILLFVSILGITVNSVCIHKMIVSTGNEISDNPIYGYQYMNKAQVNRTDRLSVIFPSEFTCHIYNRSESTKQMEEKLNFQVPTGHFTTYTVLSFEAS